MAKKIYFAASLFNASGILFDSLLTERSESKNYKVLLSQGEGFEFTNLQRTAKNLLNQ